MTPPVPTRRLRRLALAAALAMTLMQPALAALSGPVSVGLIAPGGIVAGMVVDTVVTDVIDATPLDEMASVDTTLGLHAGDPDSPISNFWMLPGESITFADNAILLHVAAGTQRANGDLVTGYLGSGAARARYSFDNLVIAGQTLIGANVVALNGVISGTGGGLSAPGQVSFYLDDLKFIDPGTGTGNAFGEFRIDLLTQPVPEPASWALMLAGLAGFTQLARRARARDQAV
jgi:hypothetical protein